MSDITEIKTINQSTDEYLELAKELGLEKQIELRKFEDWRKKIPYKQISFRETEEELLKQLPRKQRYCWGGGWKSSKELCSIPVSKYEEKLPVSALIKLKEAKEYNFEEFEVWQLAATWTDPILVGRKFLATIPYFFEIWRWEKSNSI